MASRYVVTTSSSASVPAPAATINGTRTILQLVTAATAQATVIEWGVTFDNTNAALAPIDVCLQRQTTAGTSSAGFVQKLNPGAPNTAQTTALRNFSSTDPTAGDLLTCLQVNPTSGFSIQYPLGREPVMDVSTRLGIVTIGVTANISNAVAYVMFEE